MGKNRKLSTALAILIAFTGIGSGPANAQDSIEINEIYSTDYQTNQTYIPEDFQNIFSEEVLKYKDYKIDSVFFDYAIVLFNGRKIVLPIVVTNSAIVHDAFPPYGQLCTFAVGENEDIYTINKGFFDSKDIVEIINVVEIDVLFEILNLNINDSKFSKLKASSLGKEELTVGEFIEIFKLMVPREMLPIKLETPKVNINPTIPKFKEEFLNKPINFNDLLVHMIKKNKSDIPVYVDFLRVDNAMCYGFLTNQYEFEFGDNKEMEKYSSRHDYDKKSYHFNSYIGDKKGIIEYFGEYFPLLSEPLANCETYGDLLEVYQMLPLEVQRQYKESDFKDNPYVDNSSSLNLPKKLEKLHS